jgi:hypothetical protein
MTEKQLEAAEREPDETPSDRLNGIRKRTRRSGTITVDDWNYVESLLQQPSTSERCGECGHERRYFRADLGYCVATVSLDSYGAAKDCGCKCVFPADCDYYNLIRQEDERSIPTPEETAREAREEIAALCHDQWSGWMRYLFEHCSLIPESFAIRWKRQMNTSYADLSEPEKENDRKEADRFIALLSNFPPTEAAQVAVEAAANEVVQRVYQASPGEFADLAKLVAAIISRHCTDAGEVERLRHGVDLLSLNKSLCATVNQLRAELSAAQAKVALCEGDPLAATLEGQGHEFRIERLRAQRDDARANAIRECRDAANQKAEEYRATAERYAEHAKRETLPEARAIDEDSRDQCFAKHSAMIVFAAALESLAKEGDDGPTTTT